MAFLSIRDGFDPSTPAGRLTRNVLASVPQVETEVGSERQRAGIEAAREANGGKCPWGGRKAGVPNKATAEKVAVVRQLRGQGRSIAEIAQVVDITRQTDRLSAFGVGSIHISVMRAANAGSPSRRFRVFIPAQFKRGDCRCGRAGFSRKG